MKGMVNENMKWSNEMLYNDHTNHKKDVEAVYILWKLFFQYVKVIYIGIFLGSGVKVLYRALKWEWKLNW